MSSYTINHKYRSLYASTKTAEELKYCNSLGVFNKVVDKVVDSQLGATRLVSYLPSHIQQARVESLLIINLIETSSLSSAA